MNDAELISEIETIRTVLADTRDRIDILATQEGIRGVLDPAAGGVTCVIAALHAAQEHLRHPTSEPVTVVSGDMAVELPGVTEDRVIDLMAALEESVAAAKEARTRHRTADHADTGPERYGPDPKES